jgi:hypothetical protein
MDADLEANKGKGGLKAKYLGWLLFFWSSIRFCPCVSVVGFRFRWPRSRFGGPGATRFADGP